MTLEGAVIWNNDLQLNLGIEFHAIYQIFYEHMIS